MNLTELYNVRQAIVNGYYNFSFPESDKGTTHNYIDGYYNNRFSPLKDKPINIMEIGVNYGQSLALWRTYFTSANIFGFEIGDSRNWQWCTRLPNITVIHMNAYCQEALNLFEDNFFDIIIDDGPHTLESQQFSAANWTKKLKVNGILAIEDIQEFKEIPTIIAMAPSNFETSIHDLRKDKNRSDDVIVEFLRKS